MKRIVVTGGNKGIGLAIVKRLLKEFSDTYIFLGSRNRKRGEIAIEQTIIELGESVKSRVEVLDLDVTSDKSIQDAVVSVQKLLGETGESLYGLVNNAGGFEEGMSGQNIIDLNMYGVYRVTEAFLPLIEEKGKIYHQLTRLRFFITKVNFVPLESIELANDFIELIFF